MVERLRLEEGLGDGASHSVSEAVDGADCIILAMPTGAMPSVVKQIGSLPADREVLVTDVGSVKATVEHEVGDLVRSQGGRFIGSHPMAGSEKVGLEHSDGELFVGASVILTPTGEDSGSEHLKRLELFWSAFGARVSLLSPQEHDQIVASISHLPHLVAAALVRVVLGQSEASGKYCGGGFRDTTRVSAGPDEMWSGILSDNHEAVSDRLGALITELESWKDALDTLDRDQLRVFLSEARKLRENL
tara:strand:- start:368 stop:1108 length:741 start_codon:yes stop_codon:yes gene_type:complete